MVYDDPFENIECSKDSCMVLLKGIRDRITCNEKEKCLLFDTGFVCGKRFEGTLGEVSLNLEILALLSNTRDEKIRKEIRENVPRMFDLVRSLRLPFSSAHISMFRSFRIVVSKVGCELFYDKYFVPLLSLVEINSRSRCLNGVKNEIVELFHEMMDVDERIRRDLSSRRVIRVLCSPDLNAIRLLDRLINEETRRYVKIGRLFKRTERADVRNKLKGLSCCVKLYKLNNSCDAHVMERMICALDELIPHRKEALVLIGRIVEEDVQAQMFCKDINLVSRIIDLFHEEKPEGLTAEFLFCMYSLTTKLEENRKAVARSKIIPAIFGLFKLKTNRREMDSTFVMMILFLKSMTRSVTFLRSDLLDYPIVELLISSLSDDNPDGVEGLDEIICKDRLRPGFINENILKVLVNLVMEYGDYKSKFITSQGIERVIRYVPDFPHTVLQIFRNFLYDTNFNSKEIFIRTTNKNFFKEFFDMYEETGDLEILEGCFNLMRNLLCDDTLDYIIQSYEDLIEPIFFYLDVFANKESVVEESREEGVLLQILYTIVNLSANSDRFKSLVLSSKHLDNMKRIGITRNLRIAFIWIIINLSWKEDGFEGRVEILNSNGIRDWLVKLQVKDPVLADKIGTALENLR